MVRALVRALIMQKLCAERMRNAIEGNHLKQADDNSCELKTFFPTELLNTNRTRILESRRVEECQNSSRRKESFQERTRFVGKTRAIV